MLVRLQLLAQMFREHFILSDQLMHVERRRTVYRGIIEKANEILDQNGVPDPSNPNPKQRENQTVHLEAAISGKKIRYILSRIVQCDDKTGAIIYSGISISGKYLEDPEERLAPIQIPSNPDDVENDQLILFLTLQGVQLLEAVIDPKNVFKPEKPVK